jgi:hypothetical protein
MSIQGDAIPFFSSTPVWLPRAPAARGGAVQERTGAPAAPSRPRSTALGLPGTAPHRAADVRTPSLRILTLSARRFRQSQALATSCRGAASNRRFRSSPMGRPQRGAARSAGCQHGTGLSRALSGADAGIRLLATVFPLAGHARGAGVLEAISNAVFLGGTVESNTTCSCLDFSDTGAVDAAPCATGLGSDARPWHALPSPREGNAWVTVR